jgi:hypothetical protein
VSRVGKHVDGLDRGGLVPGPPCRGQVPRERPRIARDVNDPAGPQPREDGCEDSRGASLPGRVEHHRAEVPRRLLRIVEQLVRHVFHPSLDEAARPLLDAAQLAAGGSVPDRCRVFLHPDHIVPPQRQGEREEPGPRVQVEDGPPVFRRDASQDHAHQLFRRAHAGLKEGPGRHEEASSGDLFEQPVLAAEGPGAPAQDKGPGLVVDVEVDPFRGLGQARELPHELADALHPLPRRHEGHLGPPALLAHANDHVPDGVFHLPLVRPGDAVLDEQVAHLEGQLVSSGGVHGTFLDRDDLARASRVMAHDERLGASASSQHEVDLVSKAPRGARCRSAAGALVERAGAASLHAARFEAQGLPHPGGIHRRCPAQRRGEHCPLEPELLRVSNVLPSATAAGAEVPAGRLDAVRGSAEHLEDFRPARLLTRRRDPRAHALPGQGPRHEEDIAADRRQGIAVESHGGDFEVQDLPGRDGAARRRHLRGWLSGWAPALQAPGGDITSPWGRSSSHVCGSCLLPGCSPYRNFRWSPRKA